MLTLKAGKAVGNSFTGVFPSVTSNATISTGQWYHIVNTWDGAFLRIYINGVLDNSTALATFSASGASNYVWLGYGDPNGCGGDTGGSSSPFFQGLMDDFRVYNRALSAQEVLWLYNGT